ncbi:MAG TPA: phage tail tape measure protein, partial [bacterium]|nr:phage tail tape measure protein [bacterium]
MPDLLGMSAGTAGSIIAVVGIAGLDKFERDLQKMATAVDGKAQFLNKSLTAVAAAGATVFVSSIAAATEFQSSFTGVTKTVDGLSDNFGNLTAEGQRLADQFRALSLEVPVSVNELNKIGELAGQLGVGKEDILEFTRTIAALGVTTNLTFEEGSTQIARFINVTKQVAPAGSQMAEQAERIGSAVVELGNNMATTEAEIVTFGLRIAGSGAQIGLTQDQILAFGAALSSVGIQAEMGGTAISKLFIDMAKAVSDGGAQLERMAKIAGMTIPEFSRLFKEDAAGAINAFFTGLNETQKSGESLFPILEEMGYKEVRLRDTILKTASASDILSEALGWSSKAYRENTAMADEAQKRYST